jgi:ribosomal protein S18 acetylase RimI-like enzyme
MDDVIALQVLTADDWRTWRELRLRALTEAPYAFGSRLDDWQHAPETQWRERLLLPGSHNVIASLNDKPVGMVTGAPLEGSYKIISMWVAPEGRGHGVGDALIAEIIRWATASGISELCLDVLEHNTYAIRLYTRNGFTDAGPSADAGERRMVSHPIEQSL